MAAETDERSTTEFDGVEFGRSSPGDWAAGFLERCRLWMRFTGPARIASAFGAALVVAGVAFWLLRTPALPTEAGLPMAGASSTTGAATSSNGGAAPEAAGAPTVGSSTSTDALIVVHVTGAVNAPGVYTLGPSSRVGDAIVDAGGPTVDADPNALNLAAPLVDGDRIDVPTIGEMTAPPITTLPPGQLHAPSAVDGHGGAEAGVPIDLNTATVDELDELPGVGPATSSAIVTYRTEHGAFGSIDDLEEVPGIGPAKLAALRDLVTV